MPASELRWRRVAGEPGRIGERNRWVWRVPRDQERRVYFLATLVLIVWYLVSRVL